MSVPIDERFPLLARALQQQLLVAPEQAKFFSRRFRDASEQELALLERIAGWIDRLVGQGLSEHVADYAWLCHEQINEELHFRRHGSYRFTRFSDAYEAVYANAPYMRRYMNGLLMTQLWWSNHTRVIDYYLSRFLAGSAAGYNHLEIGPGHGLFLFLAAEDARSGAIHGWDISEASIALTREALRRLGAHKTPRLELVDMFQGPKGSFDSIVFSEVLEHMEKPRAALEVLRSLLAPKGRLFVNMPINSPAPDHLFNAETPEALERFVTEAGLRVVDRDAYPATNQSLESALKKKLTISCVFTLQAA